MSLPQVWLSAGLMKVCGHLGLHTTIMKAGSYLVWPKQLVLELESWNILRFKPFKGELNLKTKQEMTVMICLFMTVEMLSSGSSLIIIIFFSSSQALLVLFISAWFPQSSSHEMEHNVVCYILCTYHQFMASLAVLSLTTQFPH